MAKNIVANPNTQTKRAINSAIGELVDMGLIHEVEGDNENTYALTPTGAVFGHFLWNQTFSGGMDTLGGIVRALQDYDYEDVDSNVSNYRTARLRRGNS